VALVSDSQLHQLRKVVERGLVTDVTIINSVRADNPYSDEEWGQEPEYDRQTVKGWLREVPAGTIDVVSGVMANTGMYRLFLPLGTNIENGDRVVINDEDFIVQDTNQDSTYKVTLRVSLARAE
jgi:hypothetical protein